MDFSLYSTLAREILPFRPMATGRVGLYVCGVTVYDYCHLGHARAFLNFDVMVRFLRFLGWDVQFVRNITDVDDKIIQRAIQENCSPAEVAARYTEAMHEDFDRLGMLRPDQEPRATDNMDEIIAIIGELLTKGFAYQASNQDIYYRVAAFADYGKLSGRRPEDLLAGARVEIEEAKEDPRDFALWKAVSDGSLSWPSPWGPGRPGWHIECSAMSRRCLGAHFDIHGGGPDLVFPHHENEIAQSEAANGCTFANYWLHAGPLRIDGEKMSKSLGNFFTIREVLEKYSGEVIRFFALSSHYRSPINFSEDSLKEAKQGLDRFYHCLRQFEALPACNPEHPSMQQWGAAFVRHMSDDFNTREAIARLFELTASINNAVMRGDMQEAADEAATLKHLGAILGLLQTDAENYFRGNDKQGLSNDEVDALIAERQQAKSSGNFQRADEIRAHLTEQGIQLEDSRAGTRWRRL